MPERGTRSLLAGIVIAALWLGATILLATTVAPGAFAALPSRELAGAMVGRVLPVVFWSGVAVGAVLATVAAIGPRRERRVVRLVAAAITCGSCLAAQLVLAPRIAHLRAGMRAPLAALPDGDPQRVAFGRLHMLSVLFLAVAMTGAAVSLASAAITLDRKVGG